jgi:hypothetical protein
VTYQIRKSTDEGRREHEPLVTLDPLLPDQHILHEENVFECEGDMERGRTLSATL